MKRGKRFTEFAGIIVVCLWLLAGSATAWAYPGELVWRVSSTEGLVQELVSVDSNGNRIVVSYDKHKFLPCYTESRFFVTSIDPQGQINWQAEDQGIAYAMAIDHQDNIVVVGDAMVDNDTCAWRVVSYSPQGDVNWITYYESPGRWSYAKDVAIDPQGNIVVVGIDEYDDPELRTLWKIISYSPTNGQVVWEQTYDDYKYSRLSLPKVVVDSNGTVVVAGDAYNGEDTEWRIVSYSPVTTSAHKNWEKSYDGGEWDNVRDIIIDSNDNIVVVGTRDMGNYEQGVVLSFSSSGALRWNSTSSMEEPQALAVDSHDNVIVVGYGEYGGTFVWRVESYSSSGSLNWQKRLDKGIAKEVAVDAYDNAVVVGLKRDTSEGWKEDWLIVSLSPSGTVEWQATYDSTEDEYTILNTRNSERKRMESPFTGDGDVARSVSVDMSSGDVIVAGKVSSGSMVMECKGYRPPSPHVLRPSEVRTINPAPPVPDPYAGQYLGFGSAVLKGPYFKTVAAFPEYLDQGDNRTLPVKIFIAGVIPSMPKTLFFFDTSDNLLFTPDYPLTPWRRGLSQQIEPVTLIPDLNLEETPYLHAALVGTHYWFTLVVPNTVADDLSDMDWDNTPWELTVNVFEVK